MQVTRTCTGMQPAPQQPRIMKGSFKPAGSNHRSDAVDTLRDPVVGSAAVKKALDPRAVLGDLRHRHAERLSAADKTQASMAAASGAAHGPVETEPGPPPKVSYVQPCHANSG